MLTLALLGLAFGLVSTVLIFYFAGYLGPAPHSRERLAVVGLIAGYPTVFVTVFFNVALAYAASAGFDGYDVDLREALGAAYSRIGTIASWSLISVVVGLLLRQIAERLPGVGKPIAIWLLGAVWGIGTLFVIPMLAIERSSSLPALRRSVELAKQRWAENVGGNFAIGVWTAIVSVPAVLVLGIGSAAAVNDRSVGVALMLIGLIGLVTVSALAAATRQVFAVALYRHAIDAPAGGFSTWDLENPFTGKPQGKRRKSWILRIGVPILALFAILAIIVAIVGPRHGYHASFPAASARELPAGTPLAFHGQRIGAVTGSTVEGDQATLTFEVEPSYRGAFLDHRLYPSRVAGHVYINVGEPGHSWPLLP